MDCCNHWKCTSQRCTPVQLRPMKKARSSTEIARPASGIWMFCEDWRRPVGTSAKWECAPGTRSFGEDSLLEPACHKNSRCKLLLPVAPQHSLYRLRYPAGCTQSKVLGEHENLRHLLHGIGRGPIEMFMKEIECSLAVDAVSALKVFNVNSI